MELQIIKNGDGTLTADLDGKKYTAGKIELFYYSNSDHLLIALSEYAKSTHAFKVIVIEDTPDITFNPVEICVKSQGYPDGREINFTANAPYISPTHALAKRLTRRRDNNHRHYRIKN